MANYLARRQILSGTGFCANSRRACAPRHLLYVQRLELLAKIADVLAANRDEFISGFPDELGANQRRLIRSGRCDLHQEVLRKIGRAHGEGQMLKGRRQDFSFEEQRPLVGNIFLCCKG